MHSTGLDYLNLDFMSAADSGCLRGRSEKKNKKDTSCRGQVQVMMHYVAL